MIAGIEVILDVVYNHTAEGNQAGPTLSFKGIDNLSYYRLAADRRYYDDATGTGNTLNVDHPRVLQIGHGLVALLGERHARRRLPVRSRTRARARHPTASIPTADSLKAVSQDPGAGRRKDDRGTVGRRPRRIPSRPLSRPAGPSGTTSIATWCGASGKATTGWCRSSRLASDRLERPLRLRRPPHARVGELRYGSRRLHLARFS